MEPVLTVVCLCYNQKEYVEEAVKSVFSQQDVPFEVIIIDDYSTDGSGDKIKELAKEYPFEHLILHQENKGNCTSFNEALKLAKGKYIIDLATDDYFLEGAFKRQIDFFEKQEENVGMVFSNAELVDEKSGFIKHHFPIDEKGASLEEVPSGSLFKDVLEKYFICVPSMVMRKSWLIELGGYNEKLSYEDFDLWVRGALIAEFIYLDEVLVAKRKHNTQLSKQMLTYQSRAYYASTLAVCEFASCNVTNAKEEKALVHRLKYEGRNASFFLAKVDFSQLLKKHKQWNVLLSLRWKTYSVIGRIVSYIRR